MNNFSEWISDTASKLGSLFSLDMATILALVLFFLSYQLFRLAIAGMLQRNEPPEIGRVVVVILPGVLMSVGGIVLMTNLGGVLPMIFYISLTLVIGYGLAYLGYRLLDASILKTSSEDSFWGDKPDLFKRAIPGAVFALFGIVIIIVSLAQGFDVVAQMRALGREGQEKTLALVDTRLQEGLKLLDAHLRALHRTPSP
jgi:hypothetical protein